VEIAREIVRRFNSIYGEVLVEPEALLTPQGKVPGTDSRKMSKSYGNSVELFETEEALRQKVMSMYTDPLKVRAADKGHPEGCVVFAMHRIYSPHADARQAECKEGAVGCVACKKDALASMAGPFAEFRKARERFAAEGLAETVLEEGSRRAREVAGRTLERVRQAMNLRPRT
jgi:tryptophanyl-tRNA synthetase